MAEQTEEICLLVMICQVLWNLLISCEESVPDSDQPINLLTDERKWEMQRLLRRKTEEMNEVKASFINSSEPHVQQYLDLCQDFETLALNLSQKLV